MATRIPSRTVPALAHPAPSLNEERRAELIAGLNRTLAHLLDLTNAAKQAHWNVRGPNFYGLHELFDHVANETRAYADLIAERVVTLGGTAHGTIDDVATGTGFSPFPTDEHDWEPLVEAIHARSVGAAELCRSHADDADDDLATQDIYIEVMRGIEMRAWMLEAHIEQAS